MDVSEHPSRHGRPEERIDVLSVAVGLAELGTRGLRMSLGRSLPGELLVDVGLGATAVGRETASRAARLIGGLAPPRVFRSFPPPRPSPASPTWRRPRVVEQLRQRGRRERLADGARVQDLLGQIATKIIEQVLRQVDVAALVQYVDLEAIIAGLDLDKVADAVDVDRVAGRLDVDAVLDRIDLTGVVRERVDLDAVVQAVDIDSVAARIDLDKIIERLDLPTLAQRVIDDIDLPGIIRESSGSMASEAVRGVRMHSIEADDAVANTLDRLLKHRRHAPEPVTTPRSPMTEDASRSSQAPEAAQPTP